MSDNTEFSDGFSAGYATGYSACKNRYKPHWIPCSERLPEEDTDVLVTYVNDEETRIAPVNYGHGIWFDCVFDTILDPLKVTAWIPLPELLEPYKEGGEANADVES